MTHIGIIGAGQAGLCVASQLRALNFNGDISLFGNEGQSPYERPPLSKAYLLGKSQKDQIKLRGDAFYEEKRIGVFKALAVASIDPKEKTLSTREGMVHYDQLVLTTGTRARELPAEIGGQLGGVFSLRSMDDADRIHAAFGKARHVLIVGGGYIGLEMAAAARAHDIAVTLLEAAPRILQRVTGEPTADYFRSLHQSRGVTILEGARLKCLSGQSHVEHAILEDGETIDTDCVIVGIGAVVNDELAKNAGLDCENGIKTDVYGRTSNEFIWAAGDCTSFVLNGNRTRLESVQNAIEQGTRVAENIMGANRPYEPKPWFWSDQYDDKLQIAGLAQDYDQIIVRQAEKDAPARSHWYYRRNELLAVDVLNEPRTYMIAKRLIEMGKSPSPDMIKNPQTDLKPLLKS